MLVSNAKECPLWYYRDSNCKEIDMVIESDGVLHPLEIKRSVNPGTDLIHAFHLPDKASVPRGAGAILCMWSKLSALNSENYIVPIWMIQATSHNIIAPGALQFDKKRPRSLAFRR